MIFLNDWAIDNWHGEHGLEAMKRDFEISDDALKGVNLLLADYTYEDYSGSAFVLFEKDGKLYEVNGGHCSCMGLERQWEPEETSLEALERRIDSYAFDGCRDELRRILSKMREAQK